MTSNETLCDVIQQALAVGEQLSPLQIAHVTACAQCTALQREIQTLDSLVAQATRDLVPQGFIDRVMAQLPAPGSRPDAGKLFGEKLLAMLPHSRLLQTLALGLGAALGISHIVQFVLGIFITSMVAAL